ncbi:hypothetical protein N6H18_03560 [Reichenbachiella agarivorans]|uniref:WxxW domain-containing protein n=1 Tax=Reichenbachiella agarivorans TaxID=2979464 RepID=A0ABY6CRB6_9BACT|nr:hypothetical protein [Reichenbachiella agarivorans]UXP33033.1 hypothetical protein N6H18_03560 [Reichenbachiella agarivorans]
MIEAIKAFWVFIIVLGATSISALAMEQDTVTKYYIDEVEVTIDRFHCELANMKETGGWFCRETDTGGATGYDCQDKAGRAYKYVCISELHENRCSLSRINAPASRTLDQ